jgi:hypothetical protein
MTHTTKQTTFIRFFCETVPASIHVFQAQGKLFFTRVVMVEFENGSVPTLKRVVTRNTDTTLVMYQTVTFFPTLIALGHTNHFPAVLACAVGIRVIMPAHLSQRFLAG